MDEVMGTGNDVKQEKGREAPSGGRVTIRELAEAAGVSTATVSNVIHGKTSLNQQKRGTGDRISRQRTTQR